MEEGCQGAGGGGGPILGPDPHLEVLGEFE